MDPIILDALRLALQRRRYDFGGQVEWSAPKEPEPVKQPDDEEQEKFLKEQLAGSAPQYEPEAGFKTAKEAGLMAAGFAPGSGIASAAGAFPTAEGGFEPSLREDISAGRYGSAALKGVGAAGDIVSAVPVVGTALGTAMKAPLALKLATAMAPAAKIAREAATTEAGPVKAALQTAYERSVTPMGLYSHAAETAANLPQAKGSYEQMMAMLQKAGVKPEELHWSGVEKFAGQPVTREQLVEHFSQNVPEIKETVLVKKSSPYPHRTADEWQAAISRAERQQNWDEAERLTNAWEEYEGYGAAGSPKFSEYTIPGGENYREVLLTLPSEVKKLEARRREIEALGLNATKEQKSEWADIMNRLRPDDRDIEGIARYRGPAAKAEYQSSHWDEPNVLAHLRMSDRTGPEGEKVLHLEEIQSDWGQAGRKQGFRAQKEKELADAVAQRDALKSEFEAGNRSPELIDRMNVLHDKIREIGVGDVGVPSAPYVASPEGKHTSSWVDLGLKRALKEAAEGGYDKLVWTPGAEQAARYDLSKKIKSLSYDPEEKTLSYVPHGGRGGWEDFPGNIEPDQLESHIGKDVAAKLLAQDPHPLSGNHILEDLNLQAGGEGMKSFYDKIVPTQLSKIVKKIDPSFKIESDYIKTGDKWPFSVRIASDGESYWLSGESPYAEGEQILSGKFGSYADADKQRERLYAGYHKPVHSIKITPKMREAILKGLPAYKRGGTVAPKVNASYNDQQRRFVKDAIKITRRYTD